MFYTCTMNPAIDHFIETTSYHAKEVNRTNTSELQPNGKGVNISFILNMLEIKNTAIGFIGGFTGRFIEKELNARGILSDFVEIDGITRINVFTNVLEEHTEYKLVNKGPKVNQNQVQQLLNKIRTFHKEDVLFVSGSLPEGVDEDVFIEISKLSEAIGFKLVYDISSSKLLDCLAYKPYCVKPNDDELAAWFGKEELTDGELLTYGEELISRGAQNVLISLGEKGCLFLDGETILHANAPSGKVVNTTCSGDTLLGTFIGLLEQGFPVEEALATAVAAGSSTAFTSWLTDFSDVEELKKQIKVEKLRKEE